MSLFNQGVLLLFLILLLAVLSTASKLESHSFLAPFTSQDRSGKRLISKTWSSEGSTVINENFIRLTPAKQGKKGHIWSNRVLNTHSISSILTFRISGEGKTLFGDGIAVWFATGTGFKPGDLHGISPQFHGFGVVFDTFRNTENPKTHRDVSVLINDGELTQEQMTENIQGCQAKVRYNEDRGDFSVTNSSRAKIIINDLSVQIFVDEKNQGVWTECVSLQLPFQEGWLKKARIAISASTGQLVDNHDILSFLTYSDYKVMEEEDENSRNIPKLSVNRSAPLIDRFFAVEGVIKNIFQKLDFFQKHFEHELVSIEDDMDIAISKLRLQEEEVEKRIRVLEETAINQVGETVEKRLESLENMIDRSILSKLSDLETKLDSNLNKQITEGVEAASGWKIPFFLLLVVLTISTISLYRWYKKLRKTHLL